MLAAHGRIALAKPALEWIRENLPAARLQVLPLTPEVAVEAANLPGEFHRDPADRIIVATAPVLNCPVVTSDERILRYPHVQRIGPAGAPA